MEKMLILALIVFANSSMASTESQEIFEALNVDSETVSLSTGQELTQKKAGNCFSCDKNTYQGKTIYTCTMAVGNRKENCNSKATYKALKKVKELEILYSGIKGTIKAINGLQCFKVKRSYSCQFSR